MPFDVVIMCVGFAFPSGTPSPRAGSSTLASSQGNLHMEVNLRNCITPKSRSWFWGESVLEGR